MQKTNNRKSYVVLAVKIKKNLDRKLSGTEWAQLGLLYKKWGKEKLTKAVNCFIKLEDSEKDKYMVKYLWSVCKYLDIEESGGDEPIDLSSLIKKIGDKKI